MTYSSASIWVFSPPKSSPPNDLPTQFLSFLDVLAALIAGWSHVSIGKRLLAPVKIPPANSFVQVSFRTRLGVILLVCGWRGVFLVGRRLGRGMGLRWYLWWLGGLSWGNYRLGIRICSRLVGHFRLQTGYLTVLVVESCCRRCVRSQKSGAGIFPMHQHNQYQQ